VIAAGKEVALTLTEFKILHALAAHTGRVFTRAQLLDAARGADVAVLDRTKERRKFRRIPPEALAQLLGSGE
jgi:DNA-binding response OmpR family regulator